MRGYKVCKPCRARVILAQSLWRNGIARWTSNPEAPGSSPGRDESLCEPHGQTCGHFYQMERMLMFWLRIIMLL